MYVATVESPFGLLLPFSGVGGYRRLKAKSSISWSSSVFVAMLLLYLVHLLSEPVADAALQSR